MTTPKFYTTNGRLTAYSFGCGYMARSCVNSVHIKMHMEHGVYHIRAFVDNQRKAWAGTKSNKKAWKIYADMRRRARRNEWSQINEDEWETLPA